MGGSNGGSEVEGTWMVHLEYWKRISGGFTEGYVYWPLEDAKSAQNVKSSLLLAVSLQDQLCKIFVIFSALPLT